jgi:hypothetical protein
MAKRKSDEENIPSRVEEPAAGLSCASYRRRGIRSGICTTQNASAPRRTESPCVRDVLETATDALVESPTWR